MQCNSSVTALVDQGTAMHSRPCSGLAAMLTMNLWPLAHVIIQRALFLVERDCSTH
jgi:hypothetical protein